MKVNGQERYLFCNACDHAVKMSDLIIKKYPHKQIVLCHRCAKKFADEINSKLKQKG